MNNDVVNRPAHYTDGKIEVIDFIEDKGLNFHRGKAVKYIARAGKKDPAKEVEDLEKARWYINREIERLKDPTRRNCENCKYIIRRPTEMPCVRCLGGSKWEAREEPTETGEPKDCRTCKHRCADDCREIVGLCKYYDKWEAEEE